MNAIRLSQSALLAFAVAGNAGCAMNSGNTGVPLAGGTSPSVPDSTTKQHITIHYTGKVQSFVVPAHVTSLAVIVLGAAGGGDSCNTSYCYGHRDYFGRGGRIYALIPVRPHEELYVYVGGKGTGAGGGFNGGGNPGPGGGSNGGGGASDIRRGLSVSDRLVVGAGGGGEGTVRDATGGNGGGKQGGDGGSYCYTGSRCKGGGGGFGATLSTGGPGGAGGGSGSEAGHAGAPGTVAQGGSGGAGGCYYYSPSCGCGYADGCPGAGGGGGYYGGGGGGGGEGEYASVYGGPGGGGGGGSSWAQARAVNVKTWSGWSTATGNGLIVIKWKE
jgi:hypothetical protein